MRFCLLVKPGPKPAGGLTADYPGCGLASLRVSSESSPFLTLVQASEFLAALAATPTLPLPAHACHPQRHSQESRTSAVGTAHPRASMVVCKLAESGPIWRRSCDQPLYVS